MSAADDSRQQEQEQPAQKASGVMGPAARMLLQSAGLSPNDVRPTGPRGIITKVRVSADRAPQHIGCPGFPMSRFASAPFQL